MQDKVSNTSESVSRFCPKCGVRVRAPAEKFESPNQCPGCKNNVLFWDITKEACDPIPLGTTYEFRFTSTQIFFASAAIAFLAMVSIAMFWAGLILFPAMLCAILTLAATAAIVFALTRVPMLQAALKTNQELLNLLSNARDKQTEIAQKYLLMQSNYQLLIDQELANCRDRYSQLETQLNEKILAKKIKLDAEIERLANERSIQQSETERIHNEIRTTAAVREQEARFTVHRVATKYVSEMQKWLLAKLTTQNFSQTRERFLKAVEFCSKSGFLVPQNEIDQYLNELKLEYESVVRKQLAKEEQARIKERLREEQKVEQEFEREQKRLEAERQVLERLLQEARTQVAEENASRITELESKLAEAVSNQRALSMAQQTRAGNVYVISNIGSFGNEVLKIGMTRRLDPMDRVRELGDASVPFSFDVHMMIGCTNAPKLERDLHQRFSKRRVNKVNFRKEFFRVSIDEVAKAVEELHGVVEYVATPDAFEYHESISMTEEEFEYIEETFESIPEPIDD